jgi:hypothetical protein
MHLHPRPLKGRFALVLGAAAAAALVLSVSAGAVIPVVKIATDPFTNSTSQHKTIVEPDSYSFGSTIVSAAQFGRFFDGGASDIGWATSTNNGTSWTSGVMPGITGFTNPPGPYARVSDPSVAFDARHGVWMVSSLALNSSPSGVAVILSRSTNGGTTWNNPVTIRSVGTGEDFDKNWTVCDNTPTSPFYGSCYTQWDDFGHSNRFRMAFSRDGGLTWTLSTTTTQSVIGGQPVVLPNGNVVVPLDNATETQLGYSISTNGGVSFGTAFLITSISVHTDPGNIRSGPLPSAEISGDGKIYVVWEDCRFRSGCYTNDLVYTTSTNGSTWTAVQRIPIDSVTSTVDHFIPGVGVDRNSSGSGIRVGVTYYYYPNVSCSFSTCQLRVGFIKSSNGGSTWNAAIDVAGPMTMSWLPNTSQGRMVGDYISTSYNSSGLAFGFFARAFAPTAGGTDCQTATPNCDQGLYTFATGQAASAGSLTANDPVVFTAKTQPGHSAFAPRR